MDVSTTRIHASQKQETTLYYKSGNFEAFARPRKPKGVDEKSAYIVGSGIGSLAAAAFLIRDGQMDGSRITILEASKLPGGALDGIKHPSGGFMIRGDREQSDDMVCLWDLMRSIPSLEVENASVLDEFYWLQKDDPHRSLRRMTQNRGEAVPTDGKYTLSSQAQREMNLLSITRDEDLFDKKMNEVLGKDFFESNFWVYWRTMFDFYEWHSALEMKRYLLRFIHHIDGQPNLTAVMYTRYNQYESFVLPLVDWLKQHGVVIQYDTRVTNVQFNINPDRKVAQRIDWIQGGRPGGLDLTENDLVFVTNGSLVENSTWGDHHTPAAFDPVIRDGNIWSLWRNIAKQDPSFGQPDKFCTQPDKTVLTSASLTTLDDKIPHYIQKITQRDPFAFNGRQVSGGLSTFRDSGWVMSWNCERQPHFKAQPRNQIVVWISGQLDDRPGDFVKKPMRECTGEEITREWLYHLGVPTEQIPEIAAKSAISLPCVMPFCTAFFVCITDRDPSPKWSALTASAINLRFVP
jgi:oleate hydratase